MDDSLVGVFDAERGLAHGLDAPLRDCVVPVRPLPASADPRAAVAAFADRSVGSIPVVDHANRPVGVLLRGGLGRTEPADPAGDVLSEVAGVMFDVMADLPSMLGGSQRR